MKLVVPVLLVGLSCLNEFVRSETPAAKASEGVSTTDITLKLSSPSDTTTVEDGTPKANNPSRIVNTVSNAGQYGGYVPNGGAYQAYRSPSLSNYYYSATTMNPAPAAVGASGYGGYNAGYPMSGMRSISYGSPYASDQQPPSMNQPVDYYNTAYSSWPAMKPSGYNPRQFDYTKYQPSLNQFDNNIIPENKFSALRLAPREATKPNHKRIYSLNDATVKIESDTGMIPTTQNIVKHIHSGHRILHNNPSTRFVCEKPLQEAIPPLTMRLAESKKSFPESFLSFFG